MPSETNEYAADASTVLRTSQTDYLEDTNYLDRRIIGLPAETRVYDGTSSGTLMAKTHLYYDDTGDYLVSQGSSIPQFDATNYGTGFTYRGNLTKSRRYDVTGSAYTDSKVGYNTTGSVILARDALNHDSVVSYTDAFSDSTDHHTYAYPTTATDPGGNSSNVIYQFDTGLKTDATGPALSGSISGAHMTYAYDSIGRPASVTNAVNSANTLYYYGTNSTNVTGYSTIKDLSTYTVTAANTDGLGRTIATSTEHPGSSGGYKGQVNAYDKMGRVYQTSNPTEINGGFVPVGDDSAGWHYSSQSYDWKGRPRITTNQDGTTKELSYSGCGCAGGEVVTATDEGTIVGGTVTQRKQMSYSDVLGRTVKTQNFEWDGTTPYQTTATKFNALDQMTLVRQYAGDETSGTYQDSTMEYDGYARLYRQHAPQQRTVVTGTATPNYVTFAYNADDTKHSVTDGRGASTIIIYNSRRLVTQVDYAVPTGSGISVPASVEYAYDGAGNRTSMTDGLGTGVNCKYCVWESFRRRCDEFLPVSRLGKSRL